MKNMGKPVGIFKRALAFSIDSIIAISLGSLIVWPFSKSFIQNPLLPYILIAFFICLYSGFLESNILKASSLGKKLLGISLITDTNEGEALSFSRAFLRRLFMIIPFYNGIIGSLAIFRNADYAIYTHSIFFIVLISLVIGLVVHGFLHPQKRALHDLVFNTRVIKKTEDSLNPHFIGHSPRSTYPSFLLASIGAFGVVYSAINKNDILQKLKIDKLSIVHEKVVNETGLSNVKISWKSFQISGKPEKKWLSVDLAFSKEGYANEVHNRELTNKIVKIISSSMDTKEYDDIKFTFHKTQYYGLFRYSQNFTESYDFNGNPTRLPNSTENE